MSASPLRAASRWADASRTTISTCTPARARSAWIACVTWANSALGAVAPQRSDNPSPYPASARRRRAASGSWS